MVFSDLKYFSYEDGFLYSQMEASLLEQYHEESTMYGSQIVFKNYDEKGVLTAEGSCDLLSANTSLDKYTLLGNVNVVSHEDNLSLTGENLKWNGQTEQLVSGKGETITIIKGQSSEDDENQESMKMNVSGADFSASGISGSFQFLGQVSGKIHLQQEDSLEAKE